MIGFSAMDKELRTIVGFRGNSRRPAKSRTLVERVGADLSGRYGETVIPRRLSVI
jgi:hypothetical protein